MIYIYIYNSSSISSMLNGSTREFGDIRTF